MALQIRLEIYINLSGKYNIILLQSEHDYVDFISGLIMSLLHYTVDINFYTSIVLFPQY